MSDVDTELSRAAERYAGAYDGRHPYTDAWPWAEAIVGWYRSQPVPELDRPGRTRAVVEDGDWSLVEAAVAEALRLRMSHDPIGDIPTGLLENELLIWARLGDYPEPGSSGWPPATGPMADRWHVLAQVLADPVAAGRIVRAATAVLKALGAFSARRPYVRSWARHDELQMAAGGTELVAVTLAEIAPALPIGLPVPVRHPEAYVEVTGLRATAALA